MKKRICCSNHIKVKNNCQSISVTNAIEQSLQNLSVVNKGDIVYNGDPYLDSYEIIPQIEEQILPTRDKLLISDLNVRPIPFYETDNLFDGVTVIIGN